MEKIEITQQELNQASGNFELYMFYVKQRILGKTTPEMALFAAVDRVKKDGFEIVLGSYSDEAGTRVRDWFENHYGDRADISYCFHPIAYDIGSHPYLLRMPMLRVEAIPLIEAVVNITEENAASISRNKLDSIEREYTELYNAMYNISVFSPMTSIHIKQASSLIMEGSATFALSRWESLYFVEKAMKEVLSPLGVNITGPEGHDIQGALHTAWKANGLPALPEDLLSDAMCTTKMRYNETPQPFPSTLKAHHSSIRLGSLIADHMTAAPTMEDEHHVKIKELSRAPGLNLARLIKAIDPESGNWPAVKILR
jgi:hypothetical protein